MEAKSIHLKGTRLAEARLANDYPCNLTTPQGVSPSNKTWAQAPIDGSLTLAELVDFHGKNSKDHPYAVWETADGVDGPPEKLTYGEFRRAVHRASKILLANMKGDLSYVRGATVDPSKAMTVAVFSNDVLVSVCLICGILRAGHRPFPISTRNSAAAIVHLLRISNAQNVFIGEGPAIAETFRAVEDELEKGGKDQNEFQLNIMPTPKLEDVLPQLGPHEKEEPRFEYLPDDFARRDPEKMLWYLHSSGSTAFPKLIGMTDFVAIASARMWWYCPDDLCGQIINFSNVPAFHGIGIMGFIWGPLGCGFIPVMPRPGPFPSVPTPASVIKAGVRAGCTRMVVVPSMLEAWAAEEDSLKVLERLDMVYFGGGPLPKHVGELLVSRNVNFCCLYGVTEAGLPSQFGVAPRDMKTAWDCFRLSPQHDYLLVPQDNGPNSAYELNVIESEYWKLAMSTHEVDGKRAYATSDLLRQHPTDPELWRIVGRQDDQIMHSTGEKTNPGPLEAIIRRSPLVSHALIFGRGKPQAGVLIQPSSLANEIDPKDETQPAEFRNKIWPFVQQANEYAPEQSRLFKEMIGITSPAKPFPTTVKNFVIRTQALEIYSQEIDSLYEAVENSSILPLNLNIPSRWTELETKEFVKEIVNGVRGSGRNNELDEEADFFLNGIDSLKATYIRNQISKAVNEIEDVRNSRTGNRPPPGGKLKKRVPPDLVFQNPSIKSLSSAVLSHLNPLNSSSEPEGTKIKEMESAILRHTSKLNTLVPLPSRSRLENNQQHPDGGGADDSQLETILLTGSTGGLGSHLLAELVLGSKKDQVKTIFALNRHNYKSDGSSDLRERQAVVLEERFGHEGCERILDSPKVRLIEADLGREDLGVDQGLFEEMQKTVTLIIHASWRMDFNIPLSSFEPQLQTVSNLVRFSLSSSSGSSPPRILFTSSVGTVGAPSYYNQWLSSSGEEFIPEEPLPSLELAIGNGYSESKAVAEKILEKAPLESICVRVGQLAGIRDVEGGTGMGMVNGVWKMEEWFPMLVKGGQEVGGLPALINEPISWIPINIAARSLLDFAKAITSNHRPKDHHQTLHLVHPKPNDWKFVMEIISKELNIPLVSYDDWLSLLEQAAIADPEKAAISNPAVKLLGFYRSMRRTPGKENKIDDVGDLNTSIQGREEMGLARLDTTKAIKASWTLRDAERIGEEDVKGWVRYWKGKHFLK